MISDLFPNLQHNNPARVETGGQSAAATERVRVTPDCSSRPGATVLESARAKISRSEAAVDGQRKAVAKQILELLGVKFCDNGKMQGGDLPDPYAFQRHLNTLTLEQLEFRFQQMSSEQSALQRKLKLSAPATDIFGQPFRDQ